MVFINRANELNRLKAHVAAVRRGRPERHVAFVGVRRIGKSRLVEQFKDTAGIAVAHVQIDQASGTFGTLLRAIVRATVNGYCRAHGIPLITRFDSDPTVVARAGRVSSGLAEAVATIQASGADRRMDGHALLEMALAFPEAAALAVGQPIVVVADEFQTLVKLAVYPPFDAGKRHSIHEARASLLGVVRGVIERPDHTGWVITGSSVRMLMDILDKGPLMGRFDIESVRAFDPEDATSLALAIWEEEQVTATPVATDHVYRLTAGHPFYADVVCREAARIAHKLARTVDPDMVNAAFVASLHQPQGQIYIACKEMYDSLGDRAPGLRAFLDAVALRQPATIAIVAGQMSVEPNQSLYRFADDLQWMDLITQTADGFVVADAVFRFWVAHANDPATDVPKTMDFAAAERIARRFEIAYIREREMHGHLSEAFLRNLCRSFKGQQVEGKRLGRPGGHVRLPVITGDVTSVQRLDPAGATLGKTTAAMVQLDLCFGDEQTWLGEVKRTTDRATAGDIALLVKKAAFLREQLGLSAGPNWFVSFYGAEAAALAAAQDSNVYVSTWPDLQAIQHVVSARTA